MFTVPYLDKTSMTNATLVLQHAVTLSYKMHNMSARAQHVRERCSSLLNIIASFRRCKLGMLHFVRLLPWLFRVV